LKNETDASRKNCGWALTADGKLNGPLISQSNWHEGGAAAAGRKFGIGAIFATPLIAGGVVYIGSAGGYLYALE